MTDRTVHARYRDMEIVRYDRAGKWYLEPTIPKARRQQVTVKTAARQALWGIEFGSGEVMLGRYGGAAFDREFQKAAA
jgi:hypothetical protein